MKKKNKAVITSKTRQVPYSGKTYIIILSDYSCLIKIPIFQNENTKKIIQIMMNKGLQLKISFNYTLPLAIFWMMHVNATT